MKSSTNTRRRKLVHTAVRIPEDVLQTFRIVAARNQRSVNGEFVWALNQHIARETANNPIASNTDTDLN